jgi:hypothetical protein
MNNKINIHEIIQPEIESLLSEKKELDQLFTQFYTSIDPNNPNNFYLFEDENNEDEINQITAKIRNYKYTIRSITNKLRHLILLMNNNSFLYNPDPIYSAKYEQIEEENKKIDDIIQPFLLPILLRSFLIHNFPNASNTP